MSEYIELQNDIIGAVVTRPDESIDIAIERLSPDMFTGDRRKIYGAALILADRGEPVDIVHLTDELRGEVPSADISALTSGGTRDIEYLCSRLVSEWQRQKAPAICSDAARAISEEPRAPAEVIAAYRDKLTAILDRSETAKEATLRDVAAGLVEDIRWRVDHPGQLPGISTGIPKLDHYTHGLKGGESIIVGGFTSSGKSALLQQFAGVQAEAGIPVAYITLEMTAKETLLRIIAQLCRHNMTQLQYPSSRQQFDESRRLIESTAALPLHILEAPGSRVANLSASIRALKRKHGVRVVYVDYLNLIAGSKSHDSRYRELAEVSLTLKQLAIQLGICVVSGAQLGRDAYDRKPRLRDLRESMDIAHDADIILLLYRKREKEESGTDGICEILSDDSELNIAKNRNGPQASIRLLFHPGYIRFDEVEHDRR